MADLSPPPRLQTLKGLSGHGLFWRIALVERRRDSAGTGARFSCPSRPSHVTDVGALR